MIPDHSPLPAEFPVSALAPALGISERRMRQVLASGEMVGRREGSRKWMVTPEEANSWRRVHPRTGRRLTLESQWALICTLGRGNTAWITPLVKHRTRQRIDSWTPQQIIDAVSPAILTGWPPWLGPQDIGAHMLDSYFVEALTPYGPDGERALEQIEHLRQFFYQAERWQWWEDRGINFGDFWEAPDIPADGVVPEDLLPG